jgi:hypothetical protein
MEAGTLNPSTIGISVNKACGGNRRNNVRPPIPCNDMMRII